MLVFSQDRKIVSDCRMFEVNKNFGGKKDEKYSIIGSCGDVEIIPRVLANYADEKTAMLELERIYEAFAGGATAYKL